MYGRFKHTYRHIRDIIFDSVGREPARNLVSRMIPLFGSECGKYRRDDIEHLKRAANFFVNPRSDSDPSPQNNGYYFID